MVGKGAGHYYTLRITNLQAGQHHLQLRGEKKVSMVINVHKGHFLKSMGNVILKRDCIQALATSQNMVKIRESMVTADTVKCTLADFSPNARAHIVATNFIPNNSGEMVNRLGEMMASKFSHSTFTFAKWTNLLLNDRHLSDEYRYVLDRKG